MCRATRAAAGATRRGGGGDELWRKGGGRARGPRPAARHTRKLGLFRLVAPSNASMDSVAGRLAPMSTRYVSPARSRTTPMTASSCTATYWVSAPTASQPAHGHPWAPCQQWCAMPIVAGPEARAYATLSIVNPHGGGALCPHNTSLGRHECAAVTPHARPNLGPCVGRQRRQRVTGQNHAVDGPAPPSSPLAPTHVSLSHVCPRAVRLP